MAIPDSDVAHAVRFIREHAFEPITLADVLTASQATKSTLYRRFHVVLGRTVHDELQRVRVERARELLLSTDLLLRQVAKQSGFSSPEYMAKVLRKHVGMNPREYRHRCSRRSRPTLWLWRSRECESLAG